MVAQICILRNRLCANLHFAQPWLHKIAFTLVRPFAKSLQQAAAPGVFAATSPEFKGVKGIYINNCFPCQPSKIALDPMARNNLWQASLQILYDRGFEI